MFSTTKKVATASIILSVINATGAVLICMYLKPIEQIGFPFRIAIMAFLVTSAIIFLAISFALWSCCNDLIMQIDSEYETIAELKKRIEKLEERNYHKFSSPQNSSV